MPKIRTTKVLSAIYTQIMHDKLIAVNNCISGAKLVALTYTNKEESAYTFNDKGRFRIVIGGLLISKIVDLPENIDNKSKLKPYFIDIIKAFKALNYHEMGHVLFTDMADKIIVDYPRPEYRGFLHNLFNIIEDAVQENIISRYIKVKFPELEYPGTYFKYLKEQMFEPQAAEYVDTGDINGFLNYLLLALRVGRSKIKEENKIYVKYEPGFKDLLLDCIKEMNGTQRLYKIVKLGEWIIENITEFDWKIPEPSDRDKVSGKMPGSSLPIDGLPSSEGAEESEDDIESHLSPSGEGSDEEGKTPAKSGGDEEAPEAPEPETLDDLSDDVFSDIFGDGNDHEWVDAKDAFVVNSSGLEDSINQTLDECSDLSKNISEFLNLFNGRKRPRIVEGFTRGRLNIHRAMKDDLRDGCETRLFDQKVQRGKQADVCVSLVCDNSGSMMGTKSIICAKAALALAQACEWSNVPFECVAFTKTADCSTGTSITVELKKFKDTLEKTKLYFGLNNSSLIHYFDNLTRVPLFHGNSEEINLYYIGNRLMQEDHEKKIMFVLCDGATTGSRDTLKNVVRNMENNGITVIAIGVCDSGVVGNYSLYKVFNNTESLNELGPYLVDTVSKYIVD